MKGNFEKVPNPERRAALKEALRLAGALVVHSLSSSGASSNQLGDDTENALALGENRLAEKVQVFSHSLEKFTDSHFFSYKEFFDLLRDESLGGNKPEIPTCKDELGKRFYPSFSWSYRGPHDSKGWPTVRTQTRAVRVSGESGLVVANGIRIGNDRLLVPATYIKSALLGAEMPPTEGVPHGVNLLVTRTNLNTDERARAPIMSALPEVRDNEIRDGTYAVALVKSNPYPLDTFANGDDASGCSYLTGFLINISKHDHIYNMLVNAVKDQHLTPAGLESLKAALRNSFLMIGSRNEAEDFTERLRAGLLGTGQPVYIPGAAKSYLRMGVLHTAFWLTPGGQIARSSDSLRNMPLYLIHGFNAINKVEDK